VSTRTAIVRPGQEVEITRGSQHAVVGVLPGAGSAVVTVEIKLFGGTSIEVTDTDPGFGSHGYAYLNGTRIMRFDTRPRNPLTGNPY